MAYLRDFTLCGGNSQRKHGLFASKHSKIGYLSRIPSDFTGYFAEMAVFL